MLLHSASTFQDPLCQVKGKQQTHASLEMRDLLDQPSVRLPRPAPADCAADAVPGSAPISAAAEIAGRLRLQCPALGGGCARCAPFVRPLPASQPRGRAVPGIGACGPLGPHGPVGPSPS